MILNALPGLFFILPLSAKADISTIHLSPVALDSSINCNRILFKGSQKYKNTIFYLPKITPGENGDPSRIYDIQKIEGTNSYRLTINLFFPMNDELDRSSDEDTINSKDTDRCNRDEVISYISHHTPSAEKINTLAKMPLTSISMNIVGIADEGFFGQIKSESNLEENVRKENSANRIIDYHGKTLFINFTISEEEKRSFESRLVSDGGIPSLITQTFQGGSQNGLVSVKIDASQISADLKASLGANPPQYLSKLELSAHLKKIDVKKSIQIVSEASKSSQEEMQKVADKIIDKMLTDIPTYNEASEKAEPLSQSDKSDSTSKVKVSAAFEYFQNNFQSEFSYEQYSSPEAATSSGALYLKANRIANIDSTPLFVKFSEEDPSIGYSLRAGESIGITPAYEYIEERKFKTNESYLTTTDLKQLDLATKFPEIVSDDFKIDTLLINGIPMAQGIGTGILNYGETLKWIRTKSEIKKSRSGNRKVLLGTPFKDLDIQISFQKFGIGVRRTLADLFTPNDYFSTVFEPFTGKIIITAKKDLGEIKIRYVENKAKSKKDPTYYVTKQNRPKVVDYVTQIHESPRWSPRDNKVSTADIAKIGNPVLKQRVIVVLVERPKTISQQELDKLRHEMTQSEEFNRLMEK